jgi:hypothetical protein
MTLIRLLSGSLVALVLVACAAEADPEESEETSEAVSAPSANDPPSKLCTVKFLPSLLPGNWESWSECCSYYNSCVNKRGLLANNTCTEAECADNFYECKKGSPASERPKCLSGRRDEAPQGQNDEEDEDDDD